jgi:hypothetical protein
MWSVRFDPPVPASKAQAAADWMHAQQPAALS